MRNTRVHFFLSSIKRWNHFAIFCIEKYISQLQLKKIHMKLQKKGLVPASKTLGQGTPTNIKAQMTTFYSGGMISRNVIWAGNSWDCPRIARWPVDLLDDEVAPVDEGHPLAFLQRLSISAIYHYFTAVPDRLVTNVRILGIRKKVCFNYSSFRNQSLRWKNYFLKS